MQWVEAMELVRGLHNFRSQHRGCVATIGNYDGLHLGHQAMLRQLRQRATEFAVPACVLSFEPSPLEYFAALGRGAAPARLSRWREKYCNLADHAVDRFVCARFDARMQNVAPEDFVQQLLVAAMGVRWLVVGNDFRFAKARAGTVELLRELGGKFGFGVDQIAPFLVDGQRVSSSLVREALASGDLPRAARLLGRPYRMSGKVISGQQLGRTLGFPTANLRLHRQLTPLVGVFAVRVSGSGLNAAPGVASLGTRPAIGGSRSGLEPLLEAHVFDFNGNLYGRTMHVDFIARLRDERWFPNLDELVAQMNEDAEQARRVIRDS
jgi:riboflavin kinase / FMN adenylyltransferase